MKESGSSHSVRGPSASLNARLFSLSAPLLLTACQATSGNVKESVFKHRLKIHHFTLLYPSSALPLNSDRCCDHLGLNETVLSPLCYIFVFFLPVKLIVVKCTESMWLNTLRIPTVCVHVCVCVGGIDLHLHTWQSRQAGRSPSHNTAHGR